MDPLKTNGKWSAPKLVAAIAGLITVLSGSALSWYKTIAGEPEAREAKDRVNITWKRVMREVADLKEAHAKLHTRVLYFQGREEGFTSGVLQAKLDQVQARYDDLLSKTKQKSQKPTNPVTDVLRGELIEIRKMKARLEKESRGVKKAKTAPQVKQKAPPAPPWVK
jgi:hypothetical protein